MANSNGRNVYQRGKMYLKALVSKLSYLDSKDQFEWFGNFEDFFCLVTILLETEDDDELSEDQAHKMRIFKNAGVELVSGIRLRIRCKLKDLVFERRWQKFIPQKMN